MTNYDKYPKKYVKLIGKTDQKEFIENYLSELYKLKISYLEESLKFNI